MIDISFIFMDEIAKISGIIQDLAVETEGAGGKLYDMAKTIKPGASVKSHPKLATLGLGGLGALALYQHHRRKKAERALGMH